MTKAQRAAHTALIVEVHAILDLDDVACYETLSDAIEGVQDEIESTRDLKEHEADDIGAIVTDWWYDNDGDDQEDGDE